MHIRTNNWVIYHSLYIYISTLPDPMLPPGPAVGPRPRGGGDGPLRFGRPAPPTDGPIALQAPRTAPRRRGGRRMRE